VEWLQQPDALAATQRKLNQLADHATVVGATQRTAQLLLSELVQLGAVPAATRAA
jgi:hypothetical protein